MLVLWDRIIEAPQAYDLGRITVDFLNLLPPSYPVTGYWLSQPDRRCMYPYPYPHQRSHTLGTSLIGSK